MCEIIVIGGFVILVILALWSVWKYPFNSIWHYHESGCGKSFRLPSVIKPGGRCAACFFGSFGKEIIRMDCKGCNTIYYTDVNHRIGDKFLCPINGEPVVVTDASVASPTPTQSPAEDKGSRRHRVAPKIGRVVVSAVLVFAAVKFVSWFISLASFTWSAIASAISSLVASVISTLTMLGPTLGWGVLAVLVLLILYMLINALVVRPTHPFTRIYQKVEEKESYWQDPTDDLRGLFRLPPETPPHNVLKKTIDKSRDTILIQQLIIGLLIIGMAIGALTCYLSVKTLEEARRLFRAIALLGSGNIVIFVIIAVLFYGIKLLRRLDKLTASIERFSKGVMLSLLFGVATVLTLIFLPLIVVEPLSSNEAIAIGLTINIIADVLIIFYTILADLYWENLQEIAGRSVDRFWNWLNYQGG